MGQVIEFSDWQAIGKAATTVVEDSRRRSWARAREEGALRPASLWRSEIRGERVGLSQAPSPKLFTLCRTKELGCDPERGSCPAHLAECDNPQLICTCDDAAPRVRGPVPCVTGAGLSLCRIKEVFESSRVPAMEPVDNH
jgi:hypothetical protein